MGLRWIGKRTAYWALAVVAVALAFEQLALRLQDVFPSLKTEFTAEIKTRTGLDVTYDAVRIVSFVPSVKLELTGAQSPSSLEDVDAYRFEARSVMLELSWLSSVVAFVDSGSLRLSHAIATGTRLVLKPRGSGTTNAVAASEEILELLAQSVQTGRLVHIDRFTIEDLQIDFSLADSSLRFLAAANRLEGVVGSAKTIELGGNVTLNGVDFDLKFDLGGIEDRRVRSSIRLANKLVSMEFIGRGRREPGGWQSSGTLAVDAQAVGPAATVVGRLLGQDDPVLPVPAETPVHFRTRVELTNEQLVFTSFDLRLAAAAARGNASMGFGSTLPIRADVTFDTLDISKWGEGPDRASVPGSCARSAQGFAALKERIDRFHLDLSLRFAGLVTAGPTFTDVDARLLVRDGIVGLGRLHVGLPGGARLDLQPATTDGPADGRPPSTFTFASRRMDQTLRELGIDPVPVHGGPFSLQAEGRIEFGRNRVNLFGTSLASEGMTAKGDIEVDIDDAGVMGIAAALDDLAVAHYLSDSGREYRNIRASRLHLVSRIFPFGGPDCFKVLGASAHAAAIEATVDPHDTFPSASPAMDETGEAALRRAFGQVGTLHEHARRNLLVDARQAPIGAALIAPAQAALRHFRPLLGSVDHATPVVASAGIVTFRDGRPNPTSQGLQLSNLRVGFRAHPAVESAPGWRQRATLAVAASRIAIDDLRLVDTNIRMAMDLLEVDRTAQIENLEIEHVHLTGDVADPLHPQGPPRRLPFAVAGSFRASREEIAGRLERLDIGDLLSVDDVEIFAKADEHRTPVITLRTAGVPVKVMTERTWSRASTARLAAPAPALCTLDPIPAGSQFVRLNLLLEGRPAASRGAASSRGPPPLLQALSMQASLGASGSIVDDLSVRFGKASAIALRLSQRATFDDFGLELFDAGGCMAVTLEADAPVPPVAGYLQTAARSALQKVPQLQSATLEVIGKFRLAAGMLNAVGPLVIKLDAPSAAGKPRFTAPVAIQADGLRLQLPDRTRPLTLGLSVLHATIDKEKLSLTGTANRPQVLTLQSKEAQLPCGPASRINAVLTLGVLGPAEARKGRLLADAVLPFLGAGERSCAVWTLEGQALRIDGASEVAEILVHGAVATPRNSDKGQLKDVTFSLSGDHTGALAYEIKAELSAEPPSIPASCGIAGPPPPPLDDRRFDVGLAERHIHLKGKLLESAKEPWEGEARVAMHCIDLTHLFALYKAVARPKLSPVTVKSGIVQRLRIEKDAGDLSALTGRIDVDLRAAIDIPMLPQWSLSTFEKFAFHFLEHAITGLPYSARLRSNKGSLEGFVESLDDEVYANSQYSSSARNFPYVLRIKPHDGSRLGQPLKLTVELRSKVWNTGENHKLHCTRGGTFKPSYYQSTDVCLFGCPDVWISRRMTDLSPCPG